MLKLTVLLVVCGIAAAAKLEEVFSWKQIDYAWPTPEARDAAIKSKQYIPEHNLILGLGRWRDKLFITVPRWKDGVAASLNYISLNPINKTAALTPYPSWEANALPKEGVKPEENHIVSTFRVHVDACDRLWVMDTGLADILGSPKQVSKPAIVVFDLNTDKVLRRYELKPTDTKEDSFFANIIVDVQPNKCDDAFAYIPDLGGYGLVVYSWSANDSWRIKHNYFYFDPLSGDMTVGGVNFQWTDGVFGLALGKPQPNGYRTLYFHPLASTNEFSVSTEVLRNKTLAVDPHSYHLFKIEGDRGAATQASASDLDEQTGVLFLTQLQKDAVACWNTKKTLAPDNLALVAQDKEGLVFTNDLKIDRDRNLWVLSNKMPNFLYQSLNAQENNFRIFRIKVDDAIAQTACAN